MSTLLLCNLVQQQLNGKNPFRNDGIFYQGSSDDASLNQGVARYTADSQAAAASAIDGALSGNVSVPVMTLHTIGDPNVPVEQESMYQQTFANAGTQSICSRTYLRN